MKNKENKRGKLDSSENGSGDLTDKEKDLESSGTGSFKDDIQKVVKDHFDDFPDGAVYYPMREEFDNAIVQESLNKVRRMKKASRRIGISFKTFRKMFRGDR